MITPPTFFVWKPCHELGIPSVDAEHRQFMEAMNALYAAMTRGDATAAVNATQTSLVEYAKVHFLGEEEFLAAVGYPALRVHKKQHAWYLSRLEQLVPQDSPSAREALAFMRDWFVDHILGVDKKFSQWLVAGNQARA